MFQICAITFAFVAVTYVAAIPAETKYTTKYDNIDLEQILSNDRLFSSYYNCLMDKGKCSPDAAELKRLLPDAIATECQKCSEKQKQGSKKIFKFLIEKKPAQWTELEKKYDPTGSYKQKYNKELQALKG